MPDGHDQDLQLLTIKEAAGYLNVSRPTIYRFIDQGLLQPVQVGARKRIPRAQITELISKGMQEALS